MPSRERSQWQLGRMCGVGTGEHYFGIHHRPGGGLKSHSRPRGQSATAELHRPEPVPIDTSDQVSKTATTPVPEGSLWTWMEAPPSLEVIFWDLFEEVIPLYLPLPLVPPSPEFPVSQVSCVPLKPPLPNPANSSALPLLVPLSPSGSSTVGPLQCSGSVSCLPVPSLASWGSIFSASNQRAPDSTSVHRPNSFTLAQCSLRLISQPIDFRFSLFKGCTLIHK